MRIWLPLVIGLCFASSTLIAQWEFGFYAGLNGSRLSGDTPEKFVYQDKLGAAAGAILSYRIKPDVRLSFQPGYAMNRPVLQYEDRSVKPAEVRDSVDLNLDYIKLPVYLDVLSDNRKWHYMAGVDFQVALSQTFQRIGSGEEGDFDDDLRNFNPVVVFGLGRRLFLKKEKFKMSVDLRFGQGILNISDQKNDETSLVPRIKTNTLELLVCFELNSKD